MGIFKTVYWVVTFKMKKPKTLNNQLKTGFNHVMEFRVSISLYQLDTADKICWWYSSFQLRKNQTSARNDDGIVNKLRVLAAENARYL